MSDELLSCDHGDQTVFRTKTKGDDLPSSDINISLVVVSGISPNTSEETLTMFFESRKRSGGGDIQWHTHCAEKGKAVIRFRFESVANDVLHRKESLCLDGATLEVKKSTVAAEPVVRSIVVTGLTARTSKDILELFFENKNKSGGGDIDKVYFQDGDEQAVVVFQDSEVSHRVLVKQGLTLDNTTLTTRAATLMDIPDLRTLLVTNVSSTISRDAITLFFESKKQSGGGDVDHLSFDPSNKRATVTFFEEEVAQRVLSKPELVLADTKLHVSLSNESHNESDGQTCHLPTQDTLEERSIAVANINDRTTEEALKMFFESQKKSGGGEINDIKVRDHTADITFNKQEVAKRVLSRAGSLVLDGSTLHVSPLNSSDEDDYCKPIGHGEYQKLHRQDDFPQISRTLYITNISPKTQRDTIWYFFENPSRSGGGDITSMTVDTRRHIATITFSDDSAARRVLSWSSDLMLDGNRLYASLLQPKDITSDDHDSDENDECQQSSIATGYKNKGTVDPTKDDDDTETGEVTDRVTITVPLQEYEFACIQKSDRVSEIRSTFPTIQVSCYDSRIHLTGCFQDVMNAKTIIEQTKENLCKRTIKLSRPKMQVVKGTIDSLTKALDSKHIKVCLKLQTEELQIYAFDTTDMDRAQNLIEDEVVEFKVCLPDNMTLSLHVLESVFESKLKLELLSHTRELLVACAASVKQDVEDTIDSHLCLSTSPPEVCVVEASKDIQTLLLKLNEDRVRDIEQKWDGVRIRQHCEPSGFSISAPNKILPEAKRCLQQLLDDIHSDTHTVREWTILNELMLEHNMNYMETIGHQAKVVCKLGEITCQPLPSSFCHDSGATSMRSPPEVLPRKYSPQNRIVTKTGVAVSLKIGSLADEEVDVLVNSTSHDVNLSNGALSKAILKASPPGLQFECKKKAKGGLAAGQVLVTSGHNPPMVKSIFHVAFNQWDGGKGDREKTLSKVVKDCLLMADSFGHASIAMPAFGTGYHKYPPDVVAKAMFDEISFCLKNLTCLRDIRIILHDKDNDSQQPFTSEMQSFKSIIQTAGNPMVPAAVAPPGARPKVLRSRSVYSIGSLELEIKQGDITAEDTDAIINCTDNKLGFVGEVSKAILRQGGEVIKKDCEQLLATRGTIDTTAITGSGRLPCKKIIHIVRPSDPAWWEERVKQALEVAKARGLRSVALPVFGSGRYDRVPPKVIAEQFYKGIKRFGASGQGSVQHVKIVAFESSLMDEVLNHISDLHARDHGIPQRRQHHDSPIGSQGRQHHDSPSDSASIYEEIPGDCEHETCTVRLYGLSKRAIDDTKSKISDYCKRLCHTHTYDSDTQREKIRLLTPEQRINLTKLQYKHRVEIKLSVNGIKITGSDNNNLACVRDINNILDEAKSMKDSQTMQELLGNQVNWFIQNNKGTFESCDLETNMNIEVAYQLHTDIYKWTDIYGTVLQLNFNLMSLQRDGSSLVTPVKRVDKLKDSISLPNTWENMGHVPNMLVDIHRNGQNYTEYREVESHFKKTCKTQTIVKIQRLQNPGLYRPHMVHRDEVQQRLLTANSNPTMYLFHGTKAETLPKINATGFNRSFAGDAVGCKYGRGVYFAKDALCSCKYTTKDKNGHMYMYRCRVIVGDYTKGKNNQKAPPPKPNGDYYYDTLVDDVKKPQKFVIFHDNQAYPEHIITFTKK